MNYRHVVSVSLQIACQLQCRCYFSTSTNQQKKDLPPPHPITILISSHHSSGMIPSSIHQVALGLQKAMAWSQVLPGTNAALRAEVVHQMAVSQLRCYLSWWSRWAKLGSTLPWGKWYIELESMENLMQKEQKDTVELSIMIIWWIWMRVSLAGSRSRWQTKKNSISSDLSQFLDMFDRWSGQPTQELAWKIHTFLYPRFFFIPDYQHPLGRGLAFPVSCITACRAFFAWWWDSWIALDKELHSFVEIYKGSMRFEQVGIFQIASPIVSDLGFQRRWSATILNHDILQGLEANWTLIKLENSRSMHSYYIYM